MYNNSNYPMGADTPDAPWNEQDLPERQFDIAVSCSLSKDTEVTSSNYDDDSFGYPRLNEPWNEYVNSEETVDEILGFAKDAAQYMLVHKDFNVRSKNTLRRLVESCEGWNIDESNAEQA